MRKQHGFFTASLITSLLASASVAQDTAPAAPTVPTIPSPAATIADKRIAEASNVPILTVQEAIAMALQNNPQREAALAGEAAARARIGTARSQGGPQVGINGGVNYDRNFGGPNFNGGGNPGGNPGGGGGQNPQFTTEGFSQSAGLNAQIPIYTGGRVKAGTRAAEALARAQAAQRLQIEQDIVYNTAVGYLASLRAQELLDVAVSDLGVSGERLRVARVRFDAGAAARLDVLRAESTLADAQVRRINAANNVALTKANLNTLMGRPPETPLRLISVDDAPTNPNVPIDTSNFELPLQNLSPEALRALADKNRPALIGTQEQVRAAEANIDVAKAARKPNIGASLGSSLRNPVTFLGRFALSLGLSVAQTLFDSGRTKSQIAEARALAEQAKRGLDAQRQQIAFQLEQQILTLDSAQRRLDATDAAVATAREALRAAQIGYEAGIRTNVEVSDAQTALLAAQTETINARFELANARAQLASSAGMLSREWQVAYEEALREEIRRIRLRNQPQK